ncbi:hypothetical protein Pla22_52570 [Rubripirellula amarantea]|uniref:Uncharacterized protein n=1 Tax=Rubripirellula amarantea TaxID=2527999 RepID=A0A5C5W927_9BACT|nr:hypothetical protein Pla22_52570 [Rubripirellula amarantea]
MTCTGARLAAFFAMDSQLSVPRDVHRYRSLVLTCEHFASGAGSSVWWLLSPIGPKAVLTQPF